MCFFCKQPYSEAEGKEEVRIRKMKKEDYEKIVRPWMVAEGWNPGQCDAEIYFSGKGKNHYVLEKGGEVIASLLVYAYSKQFAFLGAYITKKEERGRGYGSMLWRYVIEEVERRSPAITMGLFAVPAQVETYGKCGFSSSPATRDIHRLTGYFSQVPHSPFPNIFRANKRHLSEIMEYDRSVFKAPREPFLRALVRLPKAISQFIFSRNPLSGKVDGFAAIRPCEDGFRIGPLYADKFEVAEYLAQELLQWKVSEGDTVFFDDDLTCKNAEYLGRYLNFTSVPGVHFPEMLKRGAEAPIDRSKEYAVLSVELG